MALDRRELNESSRAAWAIPVLVTLLAIGVGVWRLVAGPRDEIEQPTVTVIDSAVAPSRPPPPPRCAEISAEPFVVGDPPPPAPAPPPDPAAGAPPADPAEDVDRGAPFAVEIGRGAVFAGGFAAGALRSAEGGAVAMVATLGLDGKGGQLVRLGRSRGDLDPPVVAGAGSSVLAVLIEPNAGGRAIKVARVTGAEVAWGPEFSEGRDDSTAVDVAASGPHAVVVWDDLSGAGEAARSRVMLASLDVATMRTVSPSRPVSPPSADAGSPRLCARPGGYWLGYLAHGTEDPGKKKPAHRTEDVDESEDEGEALSATWIEVVPLDESGSPAGAARAITPRSGRVLSFDLDQGDNGSALVAWRDGDTPTGSGGGKVSATVVRLGGGGEPHVLAEAPGGTGAPDLLPGWISLASVNGPTRIAAMTPAGELLDDLSPEPSLGAGEPLAATPAAILWARPLGKAMRLSVVRCEKRAAPASGAASDAGAAGP
jgi:hypothetical protein